jgi:hypothetical protein
VRVESHVEVVGDSHLGVSGCDPLFHPFHERLSHDGVYQIADIMPWELPHLSGYREVVAYPLVARGKFDDVIQSQVLVLGNE